MLRLTIVSAILLLCFATCTGAVVLEPYDITKMHQPTSGPAPALYTLGIPAIGAADVDEYGRFYIYDKRRQILARFGHAGELDRVWPLEDRSAAYRRLCFSQHIEVVSGERIFLSPNSLWGTQVKCVGPGDSVNAFRVDGGGDIAVAEDGSFCVEYARGTSDADVRYFISSYEPDGNRKATWETPMVWSLQHGPDGLVYAALYGTLVINVYDTQGNLKRKIDLSDKLPPLAGGSGNFRGINKIDIDDNGDIYVSEMPDFYITRLNSWGEPLGRIVKYIDSDNIRDHLSLRLIGVKNGLVYTYCADNEIQVFMPDGQCVARYVRNEKSLMLPGQIAVQSNGEYAVVQDGVTGNRSALLFDAQDHEIGGIFTSSGADALMPASGGGYYMLDTGSVRLYDATGNPTSVYEETRHDLGFGGAGLNPATGDIWNVSWGGSVKVLHPDNNVDTIRKGEGPDGIDAPPAGLAVDPKGFIYSTDPGYDRVIKRDFKGSVVAEFGKPGSGLGELKWPEGIALDSSGRVYVADTGNSRIQVFSSDGKPLGVWGRRGSGNGELNRPLGVTVGPNNILWIADTQNNRIVRIPLSEFWSQVSKDAQPKPVKEEPASAVAAPEPGDVTIEGIVVAGSDDFTDAVYIENPQRAWGVMVTLPQGVTARRGEFCQVTGKLEMRGKVRHITAKSVEAHTQSLETILPLGMGNFCVGNGSAGLQTDCLLVRTWGRVISVDTANSSFTVSDGSSADGIEIYAGELVSPITTWPKVGQYVALTGISAQRDGKPVLRVRSAEDIEVFVER